MKIAAYTSFTFAYLGRARVLAESLKKHNPDWDVIAVITDRPPKGMEFDPEDELFDRTIWYDDLDVENVLPWLFQHNVVEACTAVKGHALVKLLREGYDKVFYIDPDIAVFNSLSPLADLHDSCSISLTPHQLTPDETHFGILDNEIGSLKFGIYNLGYLGVSNDKNGRAMAEWWAARLKDHCFDDVPRGLFTDQRWCDLVPAMFDGTHIIRDPGYNVASWNVAGRHVHFDDDGTLMANDSRVRFVHFTKMGPLGRRMTSRYGWQSPAIFELWKWYEERHEALAPDDVPKRYWYFGQFEDEMPIDDAHRRLYQSRADLRRAFPDPFRAGSGSYVDWYQNHHLPSLAAAE